MSQLRPEELVEQTLNDILMKMNTVEDEKRQVDRESTLLSSKMAELEGEARRLRLALFAMEGRDLTDSAVGGEVNKVNNKMRAELRRARP